MNKINKLKLAAVASLAALYAIPYTAMAAVDAAVITSIKGVIVDVDSVSAAIFGVFVAIFAWKMLKKAV